MAKKTEKKEPKKTKKVESPTSLMVRLCETQQMWLVHDSVDIEVSEYPELEGMTEEEMQDYIKQNAWSMAAPSSCDWADSLGDALEQQDIIRDKETDRSSEVYFD